jgi:riboflavin kinase/FMN adenylyltransferase
MADVEAMLGRRFGLRGTVEAGEQRGRELGYPTANLGVEPDAAVPGDGIYATWAVVDVDRNGPTRVPAATSIGVRPTFGGRDRTVEAYLIGFEGDLYGRPITLEFVARLRDELRFESGAALAEQIARDVVQTRAALGVS